MRGLGCLPPSFSKTHCHLKELWCLRGTLPWVSLCSVAFSCGNPLLLSVCWASVPFAETAAASFSACLCHRALRVLLSNGVPFLITACQFDLKLLCSWAICRNAALLCPSLSLSLQPILCTRSASSCALKTALARFFFPPPSTSLFYILPIKNASWIIKNNSKYVSWDSLLG